MQDQPHDLDHELQYANTIVKGCQTYAAQLAEHGWTADDTTALAATSARWKATRPCATRRATQRSASPAPQFRRKRPLQNVPDRQNAARLAYPITQVGKVPGVTEARARFLLDEFPPQRDNSAAPVPTPTPTPAPTTK